MNCLIITSFGQQYAIPIDQIDYIMEPVKIQEMPNAPNCALGVVNYHGKLLIVFNLGCLIQKSKGTANLFETTMLVCQIEKIQFILLVDGVSSVEEIDNEISFVEGNQVLMLNLGSIVDRERLHV